MLIHCIEQINILYLLIVFAHKPFAFIYERRKEIIIELLGVCFINKQQITELLLKSCHVRFMERLQHFYTYGQRLKRE